MRRFLFFLFIAAVGIGAWVAFKKKKEKGPKPVPVAVSKYSPAFNSSVSNALEAYYVLSESFVTWDSTAIPAKALTLKAALDSLRLTDIQKDTVIAQTANEYILNAKADAEALNDSSNLTLKRHTLNSLSDNFFTFLRVVKFDGSKVYMQQCPMAFNDTESAIWLSKRGENESRRNPYLGLHHPMYHAGMLQCGETKDSVNFSR